jgi:thiamine kinase-like enzyme
MSEVKVEVAEYKYEYQGFVVFVKFVNNHATIKSIHNAYEISTIRLDAKYLTAIAKIFEQIANDLNTRDGQRNQKIKNAIIRRAFELYKNSGNFSDALKNIVQTTEGKDIEELKKIHDHLFGCSYGNYGF